MEPPDASSSSSSSMAALYARNRRRAKFGEIPLSAGEIAYLSRKDEAARRRQRLLEVRDHEKRVAQLVTQRYRDNLRRLRALKLRSAQQAHQLQQEASLGELHAKYQLSLQNVGSAHRQAREMLAELVEDARIEQSKWAYNEARVVRVRSGEASRLHGEEKEAEIARRKEVEDNLQRLKETSMKQRAQASIRARREQEMQIEMARRQEEAARFRRQTVKEEVFTMSRPRAFDVEAYQFTRLHCVSAPPVPTTALKPRLEVKVIRHNRAHPSAANGIDEAKKYRDEMDKKWESDRNLREQNVEKAGKRGDHALEHVQSVKDGEKAIEWLRQLDKAQRYEQTVDYAHEFQDEGRAAGGETPQANERVAEETFLRMFAVRDERLELSTHSARTEEEGFSPVNRVAASPLYHKTQRRTSVDPAADSDWNDGYESFGSSQRDSLGQSIGYEGVTAAAFDRRREADSQQMNSQAAAKPSAFSSKNDSGGDVAQPSKGLAAFENAGDSRIQQRLQREVEHLEQRVEERQQQSQQQREQASRGKDNQSRRGHQARDGGGGISSDSRSVASWELERFGGCDNLRDDSQKEHLQRADLGESHQRRESLDALESRLKEVLSFRQHRRNEPSQQTDSQNVHLDAADMDEDEQLSRDQRGGWMQQSDLNVRNGQSNERQRHERYAVEEVPSSHHSPMDSKTRAKTGAFRRRDGGGEEGESPSMRSPMPGRRNEQRHSLQPQHRDDGDESASLRSSVTSIHSEKRVGYQSRQRDQSGDEHASSIHFQMQHRDETKEDHASLHSSVSSNQSAKRSSCQLQQRDGETRQGHARLNSSVSSTESGRRRDYQLQQSHEEEQEDRASLHSPASSSNRASRSSVLLHQRRGSGEDLLDLHSSASREGRSSSHLQRDEAEEHGDSYSSKSSISAHQAYSPRRGNKPSVQPLQDGSNSVALSECSSASEESFGISVRLGSADATGDRARLYIQKIHERLQNFSGRSSASSSVAQYSLPLSESMSSINESFNEHLPGYGDDSFIHKLVPMFPTPPDMLAIEQANKNDGHEIQEQYDVQLVDPALSRMLGDSVYSRKSAQAHDRPSVADSRDLYENTEIQDQLLAQRATDGYGEPEMEQQSLLSDSGSGMSSVGFSALLHLTAGTSRQLHKSDVPSRVDADDAPENKEEAGSDLDHSRGSSSSDSSLSVDARFNYLVSMTAAAGESLPLHIRLPAMIYGNKDMSAPPRPIKRAVPSSSSSSSLQENEEGSLVIGHLDQQAQQPVNDNDDGDEEHDPDRGDDRQPSERSASVSSNSRVNSESSGRPAPQADMGARRDPNGSEESSHESDDEMQYESFRRGLIEGTIGSFPPPPFGNMDMSRPPPPLTLLQHSQHSGSESSHSSSSISSRHSSRSERDRFDRSRAERSTEDEEKHEESFDDDRSSLFSEADRSVPRGDRSRRGESMFISIGRSADDGEDGEERKEEAEESPRVSLSEAFRQRHPRFHRRVEENREQHKHTHQELQSLQQQDKESTRKPNVVDTPNATTSNRKQGQETLEAASSGQSGAAADLTEEQQRLLDRLAFGERAQVSPQEMKNRTKRLYQKLPEVVERKRQEEILRRRKERLAELREQEKARRLQQKQRRDQQKRREEGGS